MGGTLDMMFDNLSASKQYVQTGRLKGLAVSSASRSPQLANVPTVNETGLAKFEGESWFDPFAPARTPVRVVETLRTVFAGIVRDPEFVARVERDGGRVLAIPAGGQRRFLQEDRTLGKLVAQYGVTAE